MKFKIKLMHLKIVNVFTLCFFALTSNAQKPIGNFSKIDKNNFETISNAVLLLKRTETPIINFDMSSNNTNTMAVYDSLLNRFFDLSYFKDSLKINSDKLEHKIAEQKLILYNIDHFLDILPADSIFISPLNYTELAKDSGYYPKNSLVVHFLINNSPIVTTIILFNDKGLLFAVSPLIDFDSKNNDGGLEVFYERHGYSKIQSKLWRP